METATQELINQVLTLIIAGVFGLFGVYLQRGIKKLGLEKYGLENDRVERILENGINFAEQKAKTFAKEQSIKLAGSEKLDLARTYINKVDKDIIKKYGKQLDDMVERKLNQLGK